MRPLSPGGPLAWRGFELVFRPWLMHRLSGIHLAGMPPELKGLRGSLILAANHVSWYDGFLLREVHRTLQPASILRTVMLKAELGRNPILRMLGGTGFDPSRPQTFRTVLKELQEAGKGPGGLTVSFFPQGRIYPSTRSPLGFQRGLQLLSRALAPCTVLAVGVHLEPGNRVSPGAYLHAGRPIPVPARGDVRVGEVQDLAAGALRRIRAHLERHGEGAPEQWPADAFLPLAPAGE